MTTPSTPPDSLVPEKNWYFFIEGPPPIAPPDRARINAIADEACHDLWRMLAGTRTEHIGDLREHEWPRRDLRHAEHLEWRNDWDNNATESVAASLRKALEWEDAATVYYFLGARYAYLTSFEVFLRNWIRFLFEDENPLLINPESEHAALFSPCGKAFMVRRA